PTSPYCDAFGEGKRRQRARRRLVQPTRSQVADLRGVELADGGAMTALDVVGVNFQLRLGIDFGAVRQQQVAVGLLRVGPLRVGMHDQLAVEHRARSTVQYTLVELAAGAARPRMVDAGVMIHVLPAV